ncbi:hypothetical protein ACFOEE_02215 [Pseudoalteromonas fenneropenaei]|uniref:Uncharacterized protein n=1 Tax=Pseudoalteromonas fenneropenaei TaxID=1737459 RepID=A0ABV7CFI6_9GAMM
MQLVGYIIFIPFILFYSFVLGPVLKAVLVPGGLALLALILGPAAFLRAWHSAREVKTPQTAETDIC